MRGCREPSPIRNTPTYEDRENSRILPCSMAFRHSLQPHVTMASGSGRPPNTLVVPLHAISSYPPVAFPALVHMHEYQNETILI